MTLVALATAIFYVVILVTRVAWLCKKIEFLWKEHRNKKMIADATSPSRMSSARKASETLSIDCR